MATKKSAKKAQSRSSAKLSGGMTAEEKAALRETIKERKLAEQGLNDEKALLAKIAEMPAADKALAKRVHEIIKTTAPKLSPKTWYGMPAYYKDGKVLCFFQSADKFKARYATLGFDQAAKLDEGTMWPTAWALTKLTSADEARIAALVKRAIG